MERRTRYTLFVLYLVALLILSRGVTGSWLPSTGDASTWFHSGLLLVVVGALLFEMYFTKPTDALVNSLMVFVTMYSIKDTSAFLLWKPITIVSVTVFLSAAIAMLVGSPKESPSSSRNRVAKVFYDYSTLLGSSRVLFSVVFFASAVSYYRAQADAFLYMILFWAVVILTEQLHPDALVSSLFSLFRPTQGGPVLAGRVAAVVNPRLVSVETERDLQLAPEQVVMLTESATSPASPIAYGIVVSAQKYVGHGTLQVLLIQPPESNDASFDKVGSHAWLSAPDTAPGWLRESLELKQRKRIVGLVGAGTDIGGLKIRCLEHSKLEEGFLVETYARNRWITYQVTGAKAALVSEGEGSGFASTEVTAAQIGCWSQEDLGFERFGWLPSLNDAVLLVEPDAEGLQAQSEQYFQLGTMPHSDYPVLLDLEKLVTHHTAILGITGSGKSHLAHRLVAGIVERGMKVISVDFTGEHRRELQDLNPVILSDCAKIETYIATHRTGNQPVKLAEHKEITDTLETKVTGFLGGAEDVGVFELPELSNTAEAIEFTQLFLERIFTHAKQQGGLARPLCLILEEAHTVIPEQNSIGTNDWDAKAMVNKIAQIALQGRKYGVGFVVIAQRTANVTKTVLSQCNTVICFSAFDKTGYGFLENYMGAEMVSAVPNLKFLQAVLVGKASLSSRPVIVELPFEDPESHAAMTPPATVEEATSGDEGTAA